MSIFDLELPKKDLDQLEDQLRLQVGQLPEASKKNYYTIIKPLIRDPDTYAVLCWSLGLGLHHFYLRRWWSFALDLATSLGIYLLLIMWLVRGELSFPILLALGFVFNTFDTLYHAVLSPRIVQEHNIRLCQATLESLTPQTSSTRSGTGQSLQHSPRDGVVRTNNTLFLMAIAIMAGACLMAWLFFNKGLPILARHAAFALPEKLLLIQDKKQGDATIDGLKAFGPSQLDAATIEKLQHLFSKLQHAIGLQNSWYHLYLRHGNSLGANAFAFPSGLIVVTDELVALARTDEALLAIMSHELGHLQQRHGIRTLLQNSASLLTLSLVTGDMASLVGAVGAAMQLVLTASYSQDFEREADEMTVHYFRQTGISINHFIDILQSLSQQKKPGNIETSFLSTHPSTNERIKFLQENIAL